MGEKGSKHAIYNLVIFAPSPKSQQARFLAVAKEN